MVYGAFRILLTRNGLQIRSNYDVRSGGVSVALIRVQGVQGSRVHGFMGSRFTSSRVHGFGLAAQ